MNTNNMPLALTFDDISLVPKYSEVIPSNVDVTANLAGKITLHAPIMSAAMDTVTDSKMAIAMAQNGGIGVIHKNLNIAEQAREVAKVKRYESFVISNPITINPDDSIGFAKNLCEQHGLSTFPVVDKQMHLLGMLTSRDMRFASSDGEKVYELMSKNLTVAMAQDESDDLLLTMKEKKVEKLPLVTEDHKLCGLVTIKDIEQRKNFSTVTKDKDGKLCVAAALGVGDDLLERASELDKSLVDAFVLDSAHGHSKGVIDSIKTLRAKYPEKLLIAGNVVTYEGAKDLILAGVDGVKVGVGPGSICTTRVVAGVGIPQFSALLEVSKACREYKKFMIADGGMQFSGHLVKALAAGALVCMTGSLLAGCDEAPGENIILGGRFYKSYRGMGSMSAMKLGSKERYGQADININSKLVPEGIEGRVISKGPAANIIFQLIGGIKSGMGYMGAKNIADLHEKAQFMRVTTAGFKEGHVHDVNITKEAPNYQFSNSAL